MKVKILSIITLVFFAGMVCMGSVALAKDPPDSVVDDLQPPKGQNPNPTAPDKYEKVKTPDGDVKKPPAPGKDGKPVKYTDKDGDHYWGTDGHLYPWPPPKKIKPKGGTTKKGPGGLVQDESGWSGTVGGVGFGGVTIREKSPEEIRRETEERMRRFRAEQRRKAREAREQRRRERQIRLRNERNPD
ncbi:hypothetical protein ACFL4E_02975 [Candidatus Omnitrophota bacterium]